VGSGGAAIRIVFLPVAIILEHFSDFFDLLVCEILDAHELLARLLDGAQQFVQFGLHGATVTSLTVLDDGRFLQPNFADAGFSKSEWQLPSASDVHRS
jgi:hypothetical protein